jgi:hypothetical protein
MANPENAVEILHEYLPDGLAGRLADIAERLEDFLLPLDIRPLENEPRVVNQARRDLRGIVGNPSFAATLRLLQNVDTGIYDLITHRELAAALPKIPKRDDPGATLPALDIPKAQRALRTQEMEFSFEQQVGGELVVRHGTLRGYAGPGLNASQRSALGWPGPRRGPSSSSMVTYSAMTRSSRQACTRPPSRSTLRSQRQLSAASSRLSPLVRIPHQ